MRISRVLRAVLGERAFHRLSRAYLADCPSRSFTLRNLGSRLEEWLRRNPLYAGRAHALAIDMVRLEWAHIEAFDNAAEKVLGPEDLLELGPDFRAGVQPYVRLARSAVSGGRSAHARKPGVGRAWSGQQRGSEAEESHIWQSE